MRVVIAEDNALLREGMVLLLNSAGHEVVAVASSGPEVLPALLEHRPDAAVLDVRMPPGFRDEGLRAALAARREIPGLPVLVLSQYVEETYAAELLADGAGGLGYLLKDRVGRVEEFLDALERVVAGGTALGPGGGQGADDPAPERSGGLLDAARARGAASDGGGPGQHHDRADAGGLGARGQQAHRQCLREAGLAAE